MKERITLSTIIRTALLILALVNQAFEIMGINTLPFTDAQISQGISLIFTVVTSLIAWWKNNSFTQKAIEADKVLKGG